LEGRVGRLLVLVRGDLQMVTGAEHDQLAAGNGAAVGTHPAGAGEHIHESVEVLAPGQLEARAGSDRGMDERDRRVRRARPRGTTSFSGGVSMWRMPPPAVIHWVAPSVMTPPPPCESWCWRVPSMM